jgi:hypothetical protein
MKYRLFAIAALLLGAASVVSCIDPDQSQEVIFQDDKKAIKEYISENPLPLNKQYSDDISALYMFWEVSVDPTVNNNILRADTVKLNYTGKTLDNKIFDSSIEQVAKDAGVYVASRKYGPLTAPLIGGFIPGFEFATSLMRPGEKAIVIFPSMLGYGSQAQKDIPANSPLIFELELLEVKNGPNHQ